MEQEFFRKPDLIEDKIVTDYERVRSKKERNAGIRLIVGSVAAIVFGIYFSVFYEKARFDERIKAAIIIIPAIVFGIVVFRAVIIEKRHLKKVLAGQYQIQKIRILGKAKVNTGRLSNRISIESEDGYLYSILVDDGLSKRMPDQMQGLLVLIEGEESLYFNDKYRFIPSTSYDDQHTLTANEFLMADGNQHSRVLEYFSREYKKDKLMILLCVLGFFIGFVFMLISSFYERPVSLVLGLGGMAVLAAPEIYLCIKAIKLIHSGANGVMLVWAVWVNLCVFDTAIALGLGVSEFKIIQYSAIAFGLIIDILVTLFFFKEILSVIRSIKDKSYTVSDGIVVSKEFYTNPASYGSVNIYRVMVKTASERTHKIENVNYEQYKKCSVGNHVLLVKPDKQSKEEKIYIVD